MKSAYLVKKKNDKHALFLLGNGKFCYGSEYREAELVYIYTDCDIGFLVANHQIVFIVRLTHADNKTSICELSTRKFLSSNPSQIDKAGGASFSREKVNAWELFELEEVSEPPQWLDFYFHALKTNSLSLLFDAISEKQSIPASFLLHILSSNSIEAVDSAIEKRIHNEDFLHGILSISRGHYLIDPIIRDILNTADKRNPQFIGPDRDIYARGPDINNPWSMLNSSIRRCINKTGNACIVATARNEGVYIVEWIAYHLELGFEKIFLYTNGNQDGSLQLLRALHKKGYIELIESEVGDGGNAQVKAYAHALLANASVNSYKWCAFIDVDEFISYDQSRFNSLAEYLSWVGATGADVLALSWILAANPLHRVSWTNRPITEQLTKTSPFQSNLIKCIAKPEACSYAGPHYPISTHGCSLSVVNAERKRYQSDRLDNPFDITCSSNPTFKNAYLYHFEMKSFAELVWKYSRNRGNYASVAQDIHFNDNFMDRIGHFRRCVDNGMTESIRLTVDQQSHYEKIARILSDGDIMAASEEVERLTLERYEKLLTYLPIYLQRDSHEDRLRPAIRWIFENFLAID